MAKLSMASLKFRLEEKSHEMEHLKWMRCNNATATAIVAVTLVEIPTVMLSLANGSLVATMRIKPSNETFGTNGTDRLAFCHHHIDRRNESAQPLGKPVVARLCLPTASGQLVHKCVRVYVCVCVPMTQAATALVPPVARCSWWLQWRRRFK